MARVASLTVSGGIIRASYRLVVKRGLRAIGS